MQSSSTPSHFVVGQCWMSEGEPELGIGFVRAIDATSVALEFPASTQGRLYRRKNPPLRRLEFRVGEKIKSVAGKSFVIERIDSGGGLLQYVGAGGEVIAESDLSPQLTLQRPIERFLSGKWDSLKAFALRQRAIAEYLRQRASPARGLLGGRVQLLPHQLYVAREIAGRGNPRALLADEVGLGKTIEAAWIMHRLLVTGRIRRVLIIVPEALVNQWFVELLKRFNLSFWVPPSQAEDELGKDDFTDAERVILSTETFAELHASGVLPSENWDLVVVDEAHRIQWSEEAPSAEYVALEEFAARSPGLLLLTATPEQLGIAGHFSRLKLIDPARFTSLAAFEKEHARYAEIVKLSESLTADKAIAPAQWKKILKYLDGKVPEKLLELAAGPEADPESRRALLSALVDHYGTGRVYFRNSRSVVEVEGHAFPKRVLHSATLAKSKAGTPVQTPGQILTNWIADFAAQHRDEKTLLICDSARKATEWEAFLKNDRGLKAVSFHENLSLLARDRSAAYFEDPKGASILICSEIGGEGRNFQNASNLILPDLPLDPDVLEQRIGRLDRIGQKSDIQIYVPFHEGSAEERRLRWHDEVFGGFSSPPKGAGKIYEAYRERLAADEKKGFAKLIESARADYGEQLAAIEAGRDRLIELNSFNPQAGATLISSLVGEERVDDLRLLFDDLLDSLEMNSEDLDGHTIFVEPGHSQFGAYVPGLPSDGMSFTTSREKALARTDLSLLTWDHPILRGTLEAVATQEFGNVAACAWSESLLAIECSFILEPGTTDPSWFPEEYFSAAPIRVVLEAGGKDLSNAFPPETFQTLLRPLPPALAPLLKSIPGEKLREIIRKASRSAEAGIEKLRTAASQKMKDAIDAEVIRLTELQKRNGLVRAGELEWLAKRRAELEKAYVGAQVRLDSFLLIIPSK